MNKKIVKVVGTVMLAVLLSPRVLADESASSELPPNIQSEVPVQSSSILDSSSSSSSVSKSSNSVVLPQESVSSVSRASNESSYSSLENKTTAESVSESKNTDSTKANSASVVESAKDLSSRVTSSFSSSVSKGKVQSQDKNAQTQSKKAQIQTSKVEKPKEKDKSSRVQESVNTGSQVSSSESNVQTSSDGSAIESLGELENNQPVTLPTENLDSDQFLESVVGVVTWRANSPSDIDINQGDKEYQIKWGDTLWAISEKSGVSIEKLAELNHIENVDLIFAGDTLKLL